MKNLKHVLGLTAVVCLITVTKAQPTFDWANGYGGTGNDVGNDVFVDDLGNVFITGFFNGTVDFDPSGGTYNVTSNGGADAFISKFDASGNFVWVKTFGGTQDEGVNSIKIDNSGNIIVAGYFGGSVDFDPGTGSYLLNSNGSLDAFVLKLDSNGNFTWAISVGGTGSDYVNAVDLDSTNEIYAIGRFDQTVDFDPNGSGFVLTTFGGADIFLLKLDNNGNFTWVKQLGGTSTDAGNAIKIDNDENINITGTFVGTADFDPGVSFYGLTSSSGVDAFVSKYDNNGIFIWAKQFVATNIFSTALDIDSMNNVYFAGYFTGTVDCDPSANDSILTSVTSNHDIFACKLTSLGDFVWANTEGGTSIGKAFGIDVSPIGYVYITGSFIGTFDFDPGLNTFGLNAGSTADEFILCLDSLGSFNWANNTGTSSGTSAVEGYSIFVDANGAVHSTGYFGATTDFDPASGIYNVVGNGLKDIFIQKLNCLPTSSTDIISSCGPYTWIDGVTYSSDNNSATWTIPNASGCDSIITINLTINNPSTGTDLISACDSYTWIDGNTYTTSTNTPTHTIVGGATNGCDSIVTLNLTINTTANGTDVVSACDSYTWIDNNTYTANNTTATHTITGGAFTGCDSIVTLNLTINTVDNTTTNINDSITANATGATYQWLDCDNSFAIISGATNQLFVATANGNYAVQVTQNGCVDTSACVQVTGVGIDEENANNSIFVYPNPNNGLFTVKMMSNKNQTVDLSIINITGETIGNWKLKNQLAIDLSNYAKGIYFLQLVTEKGKATKKIVIQ